MFREIFLCFCGISFGLLSSAGVFTVFSAVGLVPRFVGKTHSAGEILLYENMIILGTIAGGLVSIWPRIWTEGVGRLELLIPGAGLREWVRLGCVIIIGLFSGIFVGCLALSIAEMLDSIPIFTRRVSFTKGIGLAVCSVAAGKLCGSLFYFWQQMWQGM